MRRIRQNVPKIRKREVKSERRMFRFTRSNRSQLKNLSKRYDTDESKVVDILVEVSRLPEFVKLLDRYVSEQYAV